MGIHILYVKDSLALLETIRNSHENAAGVAFKKEQLNTIVNKCNEMLPLDQLTTIHTVDWEIPAKKLRKEYVQEVAENYAVFGSTVPEPLFAITDLEINASQITPYGENNNFIRFVYNGIVFVKKYCTHDEFDKMTLRDREVLGINKKNLKLNIIGQFVLNSWEGKVTPQVKIMAFDSEEITNGKSASKEKDVWDFEPVVKAKANELNFDW